MRKRDALCERVNYLGTLNLIRACKRYGVRRFIYVSSVDALTPDGDDQAVKEPERFDVSRSRTSYSRSKAAASQLVLDSASEERAVPFFCRLQSKPGITNRIYHAVNRFIISGCQGSASAAVMCLLTCGTPRFCRNNGIPKSGCVVISFAARCVFQAHT